MSFFVLISFISLIFVFGAYVGHDITQSELLKRDWPSSHKEFVADSSNDVEVVLRKKHAILKFPLTSTASVGLIILSLTSALYGMFIYLAYDAYSLLWSFIAGHNIKKIIEVEALAAFIFGLVAYAGFYYGRSTVLRYFCIQSYILFSKETGLDKSPRESASKILAEAKNSIYNQ